jgi:tetratricopeptide (TPR) repeat protein
MSLAQLLAEAELRIHRRQYQSALTLLTAALNLSPDCVEAMVLAALCHLGLGDVPRARAAARSGARMASGPLVARCAQVLAECARAEADRDMEEVRRALRRADIRRATALLTKIADVRTGDRHLTDVLAYTYDRLARARASPAGATVPPRVPRLTRPALYRVLEWLTREELDEGAAALASGEYTRAATVLDRVNRIDPRGARAALLQANAIYLSVLTNPGRRPDSTVLGYAAEHLDGAAKLTDRAARSADLRATAGQVRAEIDRLAQRIARMRRAIPVHTLVENFDLIVGRYIGHPITMGEASNARRSLAVLGVKVTTLRRQFDPRSDEGHRLTRLAADIAGLQSQLKNIV